jgi:hypothetical protein
LQLFYSRPGSIAARPFADGNFSILFGWSALDISVGLARASLVDSGCSDVQTQKLIHVARDKIRILFLAQKRKKK